MTLKNKAALIGFAEMPPKKKPGDLTTLGIIGRLAKEAIADAGMEKKDIDGLLTCTTRPGHVGYWAIAVAESLNLQTRYISDIELAGASCASMFCQAAAAIAAGLCNNVLCITGETFALKQPDFQLPNLFRVWDEFDHPYGLIGANPNYALIARRHMNKFGTTPEQLAKVAVDQRKNARKNPTALFGNKDLTVDDVLNSPMVLDPLHLYEIVSPCTGGGAFIVTSAERAKDGPHCPVYLLGAGQAIGHFSLIHANSLTTSPVKPAAEAAFKMAGLSPQDMDFVQPYDCYTITVIITLEDAGFCKKGEGGPFVAEHDLTVLGDLPCNTHGGQLSFGQPGLAGGMSHVIEAARQLMGRAGERQLPKPTLGYVNGNGGAMNDQCSLVLGIQ